MKTRSLQSVFLLLLVGIIWTHFSSCLKSTCEQTVYRKTFVPVYMTLAELQASIKSLPPAPMEQTGKIYYKHPYLFVNEINKGIHVIDNTNPASPQRIGFINIPGNLDMAIKGETLYADCFNDLIAIDISNINDIREVYRISNMFPPRCYEANTYDPAKGYVVDWVEVDTAIKYNCNEYSEIEFMTYGTQLDGGTGEFISGINAPGTGIAGSTTRFALDDDYLYCLNDDSLGIVNVSVPQTPVQGYARFIDKDIQTIFTYAQYLFIGASNGVFIYDNTSPDNPVFVSEFTHARVCDPVVVSDDIAYSTLRGGSDCSGYENQLDIIDVSQVENPRLIKSYTLTSPWGLGIDGDYLFICDGPEGVKMYDASDAQNLVLLQTVALEDPIDVIPVDGLLFVVTKDNYYEFDYSSGALQQLSTIRR